MNRISKRIIGLFICALILTFANTYFVEAKGEDAACDTRSDIKALKTPANYGLSFKKKGDSSYVISLNPNSSNRDIQQKLRDVNFSLTCNKILATNENGEAVSQVPISTGTISYNNPYTLSVDAAGAYRCTLSGQSEVKFAGNDGAEKTCNAYVNFSVDVETGGKAKDVEVRCSNVIHKDDGVATQPISCDAPKDNFEKAFCEAKNGAAAAGDKTKYLPGGFNTKKTYSEVTSEFAKFKCDVQKLKSSGYVNWDNDADNDYFVNRQFMYGSGETTKTFGKYQYHYEGAGKVTEGRAITCKIGCEEAVTVEYGAPVASKAGLCFEYKVKVTSRVSCHMAVPPEEPEWAKGYCEAVPVCISSRGDGSSNSFHQGGPNSQFDDCIQSCDGGKYTSKCSNSCYKKVYGKNGKVSKTTVISESKARVQKLAETSSCENVAKPTDKCYFYKVNGAIRWSCGNTKEGRWYNNNWTGFASKSAYRLDDNGIYRRLHSDGSLCSDSCSWSIAGCSAEYKHLNPEWPEYDNSENAKKYNEALKQCKALATCTTSTAEFTISTEYASYSDTTFKEINYPYTSMNGKETDKLSSGDNTISTATSTNSTILSYNGCYLNKEQRNWYQTKWSFPGSWINNKTGEISYIRKLTGWKEMKNAFCIPLDAKNVNQKWWNWYMKQYIIGQGTSIESSEYQKDCGPYESSDSISKITSISASDIERWNINAKAMKFGYYEWNIHIQCFYALNTNFAMITTSGSSDEAKKCCTSECCGNDCKPQSYRIRSVDLNNMFPDESGKSTNKSETGRNPGFNWSQYASNTVNTPAYQSKPLDYATKVQELGYDVYSQEHLDYYFELSKEDLKKLQGHKYSDFKGEVSERENGITTYFSNVIRDISGKNKLPNEKAATECNNLINYQSSTCQRMD